MAGLRRNDLRKTRTGSDTIWPLVGSIAERQDLVLFPGGAIVGTQYSQSGRKRPTSELAQSAVMVALLYVALLLLGAGVASATGLGSRRRCSSQRVPGLRSGCPSV